MRSNEKRKNSRHPDLEDVDRQIHGEVGVEGRALWAEGQWQASFTRGVILERQQESSHTGPSGSRGTGPSISLTSNPAQDSA